MNLYRLSLAIIVVITTSTFSITHAVASDGHGLSVRYFTFTQADVPAQFVGLGYSLQQDQWNAIIELGAPRNSTVLQGKESLGEIDFYAITTIGWQKSFSEKLALRPSISLGRYVTTKSTFTNDLFTISTEAYFTFEPRLAAVIAITDSIDFSVFGGVLMGSKSISEPTAGALLRLHFL